LPGAEVRTGPLPAEQIFIGTFRQVSQVFIDRVPGLFRYLEFDRPACFLLSNTGTIDRISIWGYILRSQSDDVAASKFAIDGQIEEREVTTSTRDL
jgi:hypothetical protein